MQVALFDTEYTKPKVKIKPIKAPKQGAREAVSRYSGIKNLLDTDKLSNGNWVGIDTIKVSDAVTKFTFMDLFLGAGEISVGVKQAGFQKVASVEIDKDASNTIRNNFLESVHFELPIEQLTESMFDIKVFCNTTEEF